MVILLNKYTHILTLYLLQHGKSKGFGFVYFKNTDDAVEVCVYNKMCTICIGLIHKYWT